LADLPWTHLLARIQLRVRRFFCDHHTCPRTTFTERLPALVAPHARRTGRLATAQAAAGLALGGAAGARLAAKHHMPTSRNTILRLIRRVPPPPVPAPRVIGLDDWAKRKGHQYGTIVVDLETHAPIELLDDRLAETVTTWLQAHATVEVISRDRAEAYAGFTQYTELIALRGQGLDQATIARRIGLSRRTISRWLAVPNFPERKPRSGDASSLDPYKPYLLERWEAGCHNGTQLWRAIQGQGFAGCYGIVADFLAPLRRGEAVQAAPTMLPLSVAAPTPLWYTARQAAFLFLRPPAELTPSEQEDLLRMQVQDDSLTTIYGLTQDFAAMLRERRGEHLDGWLARAEASGCPELQRFANGIRRDEAAVRAGLTLVWSQGPVEGQVTRLKLVKRQMYGRAKLDLLRQRVLHAA
jgi:transposase